MAVRAIVLVFLLYPVLVAAWALATGLLDQALAPAGIPLRELLPWVPSIVLGATLVALVFGAPPAFASAFLLCRRYLRRLQGSTTGIA